MNNLLNKIKNWQAITDAVQAEQEDFTAEDHHFIAASRVIEAKSNDVRLTQ